MDDLVSVIVPVYNVEQYLADCIDSILNQTYKNIEVILIDDGSKDNGPKICDEYAKKDSRVQVIHKPNGGLSSARNAGMKICKGKYIVFVDSDDLLYDENSIQYLMETCKVEDADVGVCNFQKLKGTKCVAKLKDVKDVISGKDSIIAYLEENKFHCAVWNKIYKKSLLDGVTFDEKTRICEDIEFTYIIANKAKKISRDTTKYVYKYFVREVSLTEAKFSEKALDEVDNIKKAVDAIQKDYPDLEKLSVRRYQRSIVSVLCKALKSNGNIKGYEYLMDEIEKWPIELTGYNKVRYFMLKHCMWCLRLIYWGYYNIK